MASFNKVILMGRLTADPELKSSSSGTSVTSFNLAVDRRYTKEGQEKQVDFITIVAWRNTAEFICNYFQKGKSILIVGSLQTRNWTDQNGQNRYATEVVVDDAMFVDSRNEGTGRDNASAIPYAAEPYATPGAAESFDIIKDDDDLPF